MKFTCGMEIKTAAALIVSVLLSLHLSVLLSQPHEQYRQLSGSLVSSYILVTENSGEGISYENNRQRFRHWDTISVMPVTPSDAVINIINEEESPPVTIQNEPTPVLHPSLSSRK